MQRLPTYDTRTSRAELAAFLGLGLSIVPLIAFAVVDAARFADGREAIVTALSNPAAMVAETPSRKPNFVATNFTGVRAPRTGQQATMGEAGAAPHS